jgi:hypothetical protein
MANNKKVVQPVEVQASVKGDQSVKSFKQQLKEAREEALRLAGAFGESDARTLAAARRVAELKDNMDDLNATIGGLHPDRFEQIARITGTIANGFAAAQGAAALLGGESEDLQKAMLRVQGAMAFAQGIAGLKDLGRAFTGIGATLTGSVLPALRTMQGAIAGLGLISLLSGVAYWLYEQAKATDELAEAEKKRGEQERLLEKERESSRKRGEIYQKLQSEFANAELKRIEDESVQMDIRGKRRIDVLKFQLAEFDRLNNRLTTDWVYQSEEERKASTEAILAVRDMVKNTGVEIQRENKRLNEESEKKHKEDLNRRKLQSLDILKDFHQAALSMDKIMRDFQNRYADQSKKTADELKGRMSGFRTSMDEINKDFDEREENEKKAAIERNRLRIDSALATVDLLDSIFANANAKTEADRKREFERRKIFEVASTMISTFSAAQQAYASQMSIPTPDAPVRAQVAAAIAIAQGLARVVSIKKQPFSATGTTSTGNGGGMRSASVNLPTPSMGSTLRGGDVMAGKWDSRVIVTEGDISAVQQRTRNLKRTSVL